MPGSHSFSDRGEHVRYREGLLPSLRVHSERKQPVLALVPERGLSYPQFLILDAVLRRPEGAEPTALAEECFMPKQTVTGLLDQLERAGFIRRERAEIGPGGGRGFFVCLRATFS